MPDVFQAYNVTCPPNTPAGTPVEVALFADATADLVRVTIVIPDGHAGLTGIALAFAHNAVIPGNAGAYFSGNDEKQTYDITGMPGGVGWSVMLCNLDTQAHTWQVRCEFTNPKQPATPLAGAAITPADILAAGATILSGP